MKWFVLVFSLVIGCLPFVSTQAQFSGSVASSFSLVVSPAYPAPGEVVTISLDDYSLGATGATITWNINGAIQADSANDRSISLIASDAGVKTTINATLSIPGGGVVTATSNITPQYLDLIIEPQTYTPQFYAGRSLPVHDSQVKAIALLHGTNGPVNPSSYTYTWKVNGIVLNGGAKKGSSQTVYTVPHGSSHTVSIEVSDATGQLVAKRNIAVQSGEVETILYEVNTLYGLSHKAVYSPLQFIGNSMTLRAIPYNLDLRAVTGDSLFSEWTINNTRTKPSSEDPFEITVSRTGFGTAKIGYSVRNLEALLQGDETNVILQF